MNSHGQIDQIITSIIVVFVAIFLSGVFLGVSSNVAQVAGYSSTSHDFIAHYDSGASRAIFDTFLTDTISIGQEEVLVKDSFSIISEAIYSERTFEDARATAALHALYTRFKENYSCESSNRLIFLIKSPYENDPKGTYWSYIHSPTRDFSSALYPSEWQINIIDVVNGKASQPSLYEDPSFSFSDGLNTTLPPGYQVYPLGIDFLNDLPPFITIFYGGTQC